MHELIWVVLWTEELKLSCNGNECGPWAWAAAEKMKKELVEKLKPDKQTVDEVMGRGLHSSTFRLNVSTFCGIRRVHDFSPVY